MDAPLGREVGNANEVIESIETLKGSGPGRSGAVIGPAGGADARRRGSGGDEAAAEARVRAAIASGAGVEKFRQIIEHQGGDPRVVDDYSRLPSAPDREIVAAPGSGFVGAIEAEAVGRAAVALGAGRGRLDDVIDHGVGITVDRAARHGGAGRRSRHGGSAPERPRAGDGARSPAAGRADLRRAARRAADRRRSGLRRRFSLSSARIHVRSTQSGRSSAPEARPL